MLEPVRVVSRACAVAGSEGLGCAYRVWYDARVKVGSTVT